MEDKKLAILLIAVLLIGWIAGWKGYEISIKDRIKYGTCSVRENKLHCD